MSRGTPQRTTRTREGSPRRRLVTRQLNALVEEAIIDAHDPSEQRVGFLATLEDQLTVPFTTKVLGAPVRVERVDFNDAEEIVAVCRHGRHRQLISLVNLPLPSPPPVGWEWIEAYRHWVRGGR